MNGNLLVGTMTQFIKIIVSIVIFNSLCNNDCFANVGIIKSIIGNVFIFHKGEVLKARKGSLIPDYASVATEVGSQVTISDYHDRFFHLSGSGNLSFLKNLVELKSGYLWVQANKGSQETIINTSNGQILFSKAEGVISFDNESQKTQVLSIDGHFDVANVERSTFSERVQSGMFSFIDDGYDDGRPRKSTPIGKASYIKITSLFEGIEPLNKNILIGGLVTSYSKHKKSNSKGRYLASTTVPSKEIDSGKKFIEKELNKLKKIDRRPRLKTSPVKINIFWGDRKLIKKVSKNNFKKEARSRAPTSTEPAHDKSKKSKFENDLIEQYKKQQKHDRTLKQLIEDLDAYKADFNTNY